MAKKNQRRYHKIRAGILSASVLGFLPLLGAIGMANAGTADEGAASPAAEADQLSAVILPMPTAPTTASSQIVTTAPAPASTTATTATATSASTAAARTATVTQSATTNARTRAS